MKKLRKSARHKSIFGICGGIADFLGISALSIRLIFLITLPTSILIYIILHNSMDEERRTL
ncbi:PspC domain-containing protein [Paenibacillus camelliae]|uniref:PspC domain-containing protein n=1 Tax=Paenibacillus camelliae TaxID=512410 RepID=UPI00203D4751|nr:PspC domain-containing protein [Paenibacillus camelliae]MCM3633556.1 PspC domain-containing protein [Paenibacillus camelliae]